MIDWDVAVSTARRLVRPGPPTTSEEARATGDELRRLVPIAEGHVAAITGLTIPDLDIPVAVVDRVGWVQANVEGFQVVLTPLVDKITARRSDRSTGLLDAVGPKVTGVQVGTLMAYIASRVLGQFELFLAAGGPGRLTLVAPNIVETERRLDVDPHDFRLWVTLHEVTHRTQFTAVPWLRPHFSGLVERFVEASDLDAAELISRLKSAVGAVRDAATGGGGVSMIEAVQTPAQRAVLSEVQALMSLLEGHADVVMDAIGPDVVPTIAEIRRRFDERRKGSGPVDRIIRSLLGLDLKMRQYAEGAAFVRHVVDAEGMARFNIVWTSPETLPTEAEIRDPQAWIGRVLGGLPDAADGA